MIWTGAVGVGLKALLARRRAQLADRKFWATQSRRVQTDVLRSLLKTAAPTEIGRAHGFDRMAAIPDPVAMVEAYRRAMPIVDWYGFQERIARMREHGVPDVLWPGLVTDFAQTSGTTAGDKFIPVSKAMLASNRKAALDIYAHLANRGLSLPALWSGRMLFLGGSSDLSTNEHGIRTGDLSGLVTRLITWPLSSATLPGTDIALMNHWPSKIDAIAKRCIDEDVRFISGMPSWSLVLFERLIELARARGRDVSSVRDIWPNLRVFVHGGVKYTPFESRVRQMYSGGSEGAGSDIPDRIEVYAASEAFVATQDVAGELPMRLNVDHGVFYEFVPLGEIDTPGARGFGAWEVEAGQRYVVVLTTCAGLFRYVLGDVVEFDEAPSFAIPGPARLRIVGRHRHFINAFGENLIVEHIENAVVAAAKATGLLIGEFTAAPVYPGPATRAGLELVLEVADPCGLDGAASGTFRDAFDGAIKAQNVDYTTKRTDDTGMAPPTISAVPMGTFHRWMDAMGKLGGQHKCPRCANHRELVEGVLAIAEPR